MAQRTTKAARRVLRWFFIPSIIEDLGRFYRSRESAYTSP
jgi:hypothetical protein